jgi:2-haloacid dehalogenase
MKRYELLFLDADETLFDFRRAERGALEGAFRRFALEPAESALGHYDEINRGLWALLERGGIDQASLKVERFRLLFERLGVRVDAKRFSASYIELLSRGSYLIEGAESICEYLSAKYTLAILTNGIKDVQIPRIEGSALRKHFSAIVVSEEAGSSKPSAGIFDYACARTGFRDKDRMLIIGDSLSSDIMGGINYGIDSCWANLGRAENGTGLVPTYEIRKLAELRNIL